MPEGVAVGDGEVVGEAMTVINAVAATVADVYVRRAVVTEMPVFRVSVAVRVEPDVKVTSPARVE